MKLFFRPLLLLKVEGSRDNKLQSENCVSKVSQRV